MYGLDRTASLTLLLGVPLVTLAASTVCEGPLQSRLVYRPDYDRSGELFGTGVAPYLMLLALVGTIPALLTLVGLVVAAIRGVSWTTVLLLDLPWIGVGLWVLITGLVTDASDAAAYTPASLHEHRIATAVILAVYLALLIALAILGLALSRRAARTQPT